MPSALVFEKMRPRGLDSAIRKVAGDVSYRGQFDERFKPTLGNLLAADTSPFKFLRGLVDTTCLVCALGQFCSQQASPQTGSAGQFRPHAFLKEYDRHPVARRKSRIDRITTWLSNWNGNLLGASGYLN